MADEKEVQKGFPKDGDEYHEETDKDEGGDESEKGEEEEDKQEDEDLKSKIARLEGEISVLKSIRTAPEPEKREEKKPEPRDWEKLIFEDTPNAIALLKEDIRKEITTELRSEYRKDTGEKEFWGGFYSDHEDLKEDKDLVQATLASNMRALQDLPVSEAAKKLADLTRARILRYKGGETEQKNNKKTKVEGTGAPSGKKPAPETPKILSLGDVIRARRAARNKKAVTA